MGMLLTCTNRSCLEVDYHRLNEETGKVICTKCSQPVEVSDYAKRALASMKQIVKQVRSDFEVECLDCGAIGAPVLRKYSSTVTKVVCSHCGSINKHLSTYFVESLKMKPGIKTIQATREEVEELGLSSAAKFNKAHTAKLEVAVDKSVLVTPPEDEKSALEVLVGNESVVVSPTGEVIAGETPTKVEYYPWEKTKEAGEKVVKVVLAEDLESKTDDLPEVAPIPKVSQPKEPKNKLPNEDLLRQRISSSSAGVSLHTKPNPPKGFSLSDCESEGVTDYAGDLEG